MRKDELLLLVGEMRESREVLQKIHHRYNSYLPVFVNVNERELRDALMLADILCNTYTCVETILFRISEFLRIIWMLTSGIRSYYGKCGSRCQVSARLFYRRNPMNYWMS
ncbi:hypothetical protein WDW89_05915 [Deltaproteobacteria bacterium TL4]